MKDTGVKSRQIENELTINVNEDQKNCFIGIHILRKRLFTMSVFDEL